MVERSKGFEEVLGFFAALGGVVAFEDGGEADSFEGKGGIAGIPVRRLRHSARGGLQGEHWERQFVTGFAGPLRWERILTKGVRPVAVRCLMRNSMTQQKERPSWWHGQKAARGEVRKKRDPLVSQSAIPAEIVILRSQPFPKLALQPVALTQEEAAIRCRRISDLTFAWISIDQRPRALP